MIFLARTVIDQSSSAAAAATEVQVIINSPFSWIPLVLIDCSVSMTTGHLQGQVADNKLLEFPVANLTCHPQRRAKECWVSNLGAFPSKIAIANGGVTGRHYFHCIALVAIHGQIALCNA